MKANLVAGLLLVVGSGCFAFGHHLGKSGAAPKPTYLAVGVANHTLHSVSTVVQDGKDRFVVVGDTVQFLSDGPVSAESTLRPFALQYQRRDFFSAERSHGALRLVLWSERAKDETFIVRDGTIQVVDVLARSDEPR